MKNTIVTGSLIVFSDGFVWKRLSNEKAYKIWVSAENEDFELYKVRVDDESESLIESLEDLQDAFKQGHHVCIEVGKITLEEVVCLWQWSICVYQNKNA